MAFLFSGRLRIHQVVPSSFSTLTVLYSFHNVAAMFRCLLGKFSHYLFVPARNCQGKWMIRYALTGRNKPIEIYRTSTAPMVCRAEGWNPYSKIKNNLWCEAE